MTLCTFSKDFFTRFCILYHIIFFSTGIISYYLILTTRNNPGIVVAKNFVETTTEELNVSNLNTNNPGNSLESIEINTNVSYNSNTLDEIYKMFEENCEICSVIKPLRAKHCSRCGYCIRKFDHHCFLIGGCVGEKNHFKFYVYLFTQSVSLLLAIVAILDTVSTYLENTNEKYYKVPLILYTLLAILSGYLLLTTVLFLFHSYLLLTNQTTYEIYHKSHLYYMVKFKELKKEKMENLNIKIPGSMPFLPFDLGLKENIKMVYCNSIEYDWSKIFFQNLNSFKKNFNLCENEYWSCF